MKQNKVKEKIETNPDKTEEEPAEKSAKDKISDWGAKGFFEATATVQLTANMCGTRPSNDGTEGLSVFPRNEKGEIAIPEGYIRGAMRDSAPFVGSPQTLCNHMGVSEVEIDVKQPQGQETYTGTPRGGRGVVSIHEIVKAGAVIKFKLLMPKVTHSQEKLKKHLQWAGEYCGLGALRKQGYGRFKVIKLDCNGA